jgi:hypothetical protein
MSMFHTKIKDIERERNSVLEVWTVLLQHRTEVRFLSLKNERSQAKERQMDWRKQLSCL